VNLPFSRIGVVAGDEIRVPMDADESRLEACRLALETALNNATDRAYAIADDRPGERRG
jgi:lysophospholipid acyltransferase (LPLAT)-like uncharacterized protein